MNMEKHEWSGHVPGLKHKGSEPHLIFEIMRTHHALINVFLRKVGMPFSRLTLSQRNGNFGNCPPFTHINGAAVTRQIKEIEELGLVARRHDERDGRRSHVKLTSKGRKLFEQIHQKQHDFEIYLASGELTLEEVQTAAKVLSCLRSVLERMD
jgi:DNA-binding PadR family transcriptional regulator